MKILTYVFGTLFIFGVLTWISYHDEMAYDGETTVGFPLTFYRLGAGQNLDTGAMQQFRVFSLIPLLTDLLTALVIFSAIYFLLRMMKRNKK